MIVNKVLTLFVEKLKDGKLTAEDIDYLFQKNPSFKDYFLNTTLIFDVTTGLALYEKDISNDSKLHIPALNLLFYLNKNYLIAQKLLEIFKDEIEPFKEVYLVAENSKRLVHGIDLYSLINFALCKEPITNKIVFDLKINSLEQYFSCVKKNMFKKTINGTFVHDMKIEEWNYNKYVNFLLSYEDLYIKNPNMLLEQKNIPIKIITSNGVALDLSFGIIPCNIDEATHHEVLELNRLVKYKLLNNQINFEWTTDKVLDLLTTKNDFTQETKYFAQLLRTIAKSNRMIFDQETMSVLYLKNKEVFQDLASFMNQEGIVVQETVNAKDLSMNNAKVNVNWENHLTEITNILTPKKETDIVVFNKWKELEEQIKFLLEEKNLPFFEKNYDEKVNFEHIISKYIIRVLENYFSIPERLRIKEENDYIKMTVEQLTKISHELERIENLSLEESMKDIRVFDRFLTNRLNLK